jgi:starch synthase (maltosyl-transferring)
VVGSAGHNEASGASAGRGERTRELGPPSRVVIECVVPAIDGGSYPVKRVAGEALLVHADVFADGHDELTAVLRYRRAGEEEWREVPMEPVGHDRWRAEIVPDALGRYEYAVQAWIDRFASWRGGLAKKVAAGLAVAGELLEGAGIIRGAAARATGSDKAWLDEQAAIIGGAGMKNDRVEAALCAALADCMRRHPDRSGAATSAALPLWVDRERARFGAWYEMFPRSSAAEPGRHGTFRDCEARLPYIAGMGFDVLYLPPIHPIGTTHRKGKNNAPAAAPDDVGSPWAIGAPEGGHTAVHPALGTLADFDRLVAAARGHGIEIALDLAFQCSPDHPYVKEHPQWFRRRPDGTIQHAENPPKKYEDIYPLDFENPDWQALWHELKRVVLFWVGRGVSIFRVDNPHTKPFPFWDWLIAEVRSLHPEVLFLAEAFTRPKVMRRLAKGGFSQSYTYFTWRNTKAELIAYFTELTREEPRHYMRPNLFANTPDILHEFLQFGGRPAFLIRLVLAATLGGNYGIYGPAFELCEGAAVPGTEEYAGSEKYQLRHWDLDRPGNIRAFISRVNEIRRANPALTHDDSLRFYPIDNEQLIAYGKRTPDGGNAVLVIVNLDPHHVQQGFVELPLDELGIDPGVSYQMHDLLGDARYLWHGRRNYVELDPRAAPAHVFRLRRRVRTERDFDYFL